MAALTSAQHAGILMFLWIIGSLAAGDLEELKAKPGEDVTLQCNGPTDAAITVLEWSRPELEPYVFYFRDNEPMESFQNPRYLGRVELNNPVMNNGDVSVLLKNVSINDTGKYQCEVITRSNNRRRRDLREFVRSVHLIVSEGPEQPGGPRRHAVLGAVLVLVCLTVGVVVVLLKNKKSQRVKVKGSEECFGEVLLIPDCPPSPASKLIILSMNHYLVAVEGLNNPLIHKHLVQVRVEPNVIPFGSSRNITHNDQLIRRIYFAAEHVGS